MKINSNEKKVLEIVCNGVPKGWPQKQMAKMVGKKESAFRQMLLALRVKFGCATTAELSHYAKEHILTNVRAGKKRR
jgi:hypothetical protein